MVEHVFRALKSDEISCGLFRMRFLSQRTDIGNIFQNYVSHSGHKEKTFRNNTCESLVHKVNVMVLTDKNVKRVWAE